MNYVLPPTATPAVPVAGTDALFAVHRIYCVGRNYVEHAVEMGYTGREPPFFFMKPADAVLPVAEGTLGRMRYPSLTKSLHHEVELVVAIGKGGRNIAAADAQSHIWGYGVGLDMTRRDLQGEAKKLGRPWEVGKAFEKSAPLSSIAPAAVIGHPDAGAIRLKLNGKTVQDGDLNQLIWKVPETIAYLSRLFVLAPGDIIMAGTPAGVGPVKRGDLLEGHIDRVGDLSVRVV
jgi:fumarylpyruvate hydrolase